MTKQPWTILESDIGTTIHGGNRSGRTGHISRSSSAKDLKSMRMVLVHKPTEVSVSGEIETGNYTNEQMKRATQLLKQRLIPKLQDKVAKHLKIPGYWKGSDI